MPKRTWVSTQTKATFQTLRAAGNTISDIAAETGYSEGTVWRHLKNQETSVSTETTNYEVIKSIIASNLSPTTKLKVIETLV